VKAERKSGQRDVPFWKIMELDQGAPLLEWSGLLCGGEAEHGSSEDERELHFEGKEGI
jgi:hypothetical protein